MLLLLLVLLPGTLACRAASAQAAPPWHEHYPPVRSAAADRLLRRAIERARALLGEPVVPIRRVHLRLSTPLDPGRGLRSGFRLTELVSAREGVFTIYLSRSPAEYAFEGQLAHEAAHLLNARLSDVYAEGVCTVFAERLLRERGSDWTGWERHFRSGEDRLHGLSYAMMSEVWSAAGDEAMRRFLSHAKLTHADGMHLDVEAWLRTLPPPVQRQVRGIIGRHAAPIRRELGRTGTALAFVLPRP
ncbi:MAG TPA: hypothetical protein VF263_08480 [Longimicrobiaceae bacterium]